MPLFLILFLSIYGGLHAYTFFRLRTAFSLCRSASLFLMTIFLFMTFAPLLVRLSEYAGIDRCAIIIAWPAYLWMGFIFIFASLLFMVDLIKLGYQLANLFFSAKTPALLESPFTCGFAFFLSITAGCYACFEARQIKSEQITIETTKLSHDSQKIRIVQISDVHIGMLFREERLEGVLKVIREAKPDIIVSTGDLVDGKLNREYVKFQQDTLAAMLASLKAPAGKYAVAGNHEFHAGIDESLAFTTAAGFTVLRNESAPLANGIIVSGVEDQIVSGKRSRAETEITEKRVLEIVPKKAFHLFLKHRPDISATTDGLFDLQLSGHVHNGQIFPFNLLVKLKHPISCGTTTTAAGSHIHVSRGTGTWGPPMRLFAPPEVTVIDIVPK